MASGTKLYPTANRSLTIQQAYEYELEKNLKLAAELQKKTIECEKLSKKYSDLEQKMAALDNETKRLLEDAKSVIEVKNNENNRIKMLLHKLSQQKIPGYENLKQESSPLLELSDQIAKEYQKNCRLEKELARVKEEIKALIAENIAKNYRIAALEKQLEETTLNLEDIKAKWEEREDFQKDRNSRKTLAKELDQIAKILFITQNGLFDFSQEGTLDPQKITRKVEALTKHLAMAMKKLSPIKDSVVLENQLDEEASKKRKNFINFSGQEFRTTQYESPRKNSPDSQGNNSLSEMKNDNLIERVPRSSSKTRPTSQRKSRQNSVDHEYTTPFSRKPLQKISATARINTEDQSRMPREKTREIESALTDSKVRKSREKYPAWSKGRRNNSTSKSRKLSRDSRSISQDLSKKELSPDKTLDQRDTSPTSKTTKLKKKVLRKKKKRLSKKKKPEENSEDNQTKITLEKEKSKELSRFSLKTNLVIEIPETDYLFAHLPNGEKLAYIDASPIDPKGTLIMLHGHLGTSLIFRNLMERLCTSVRVIAVDLRGFGKSTGNKEVLSISEYADDIKMLADSLQLKSAAIIGTSLGGGVALSLACQYPDFVDRVIMVASMGLRGWTTDDKEVDFEEIILTDKISRLLSEAKKENVAYFERILKPYSSLLGPERFHELCKESANYKGIETAIRLMANADLIENLDDLKANVLVIHGEKDKLFSKQVVDEIVDEIGETSMLELWKEYGELILAEAPEQIAEAVEIFVTT